MNVTLSINDPDEFARQTGGDSIAVILIEIFMYLFAFYIACAGIIAADLSRARGESGDHFGEALRYALPITLAGVVISVLGGFSFVLFVVPGLYVLGIWFVVYPAIIDGTPWSELTKGYRWTMVGLVIVWAVIQILIFLVMGGIQYLVSDLGTAGLFASGVISIGANAVSLVLSALMCAHAYLRLMEIKGADSHVAEVFA